MRLEPMGEWAMRLFDLPVSSASAAHELAKLPGVVDVVPASDCVGIYFGPDFDEASLRGLDFVGNERVGRVHQVPVCYELGFDLETVCRQLKLSEDEFIRLHTGANWPCFAIGFCPGFAYLGPIEERLRGVPRLSSPRVRTLAGSVGLTGSQTAVYPLVRPGGWPVIGMTPLKLVDVANRYFPISVGDFVRFCAISEPDYLVRKGETLETH